ncbi:MAG: hypothetical protein ACFBSD_05520 [Paracoccaceae bacterium]
MLRLCLAGLLALGAVAAQPAPALAQQIEILDATYGGNCGARRGNATADIARACNGDRSCEYRINHRRIGDPAPGCRKAYNVVYQCRGSGAREVLRPEASGQRVYLRCRGNGAISVGNATYGANCDARYGNVTWKLREACNGRNRCEFLVDVRGLGDPAPNCPKNFVVDYNCGGGRGGPRLDERVRPEASGATIRLACR